MIYDIYYIVLSGTAKQSSSLSFLIGQRGRRYLITVLTTLFIHLDTSLNAMSIGRQDWGVTSAGLIGIILMAG